MEVNFVSDPNKYFISVLFFVVLQEVTNKDTYISVI